MSPVSALELGMILNALGSVEGEARELCCHIITERPELRSLIAPLEKSIRAMDNLDCVKKRKQEMASE